MNNITGNKAFIGEDALLKALKNTTVNCFRYDVSRRTAVIMQKTGEITDCRSEYENMPYSFAEDFVYEKDKQEFIKMYSSITEGNETADALFRNKSGINWYHVTMTVTERDEEGKPLTAVGIAEDLSKSKRRELRYSKWIDALGEIYRARCYVNVVDRTYVYIGDEKHSPLPQSGSSEKLMRFYAENMVHPDDREEYTKKLCVDYVRSRLNEKNRSFSLEYRQLDSNKEYHWVRGTVILSDTLEDGSPHHIAYTVQYIDDEIEERTLLDSSFSLMRDTYYRVGCIDLNRNSMRTISISESERNEIPLFKSDFASAIKDFAHNYVLNEYREKFLNIMLPERMKNIFDIGSEYIDIAYRRLESGVPTWVRTELIPMQGYSPEKRLVMWYEKNISDEKAAEERLSQKLLQMNADANLRLETILGGISGGFVINSGDENYTYRYVSESAAALFGYTVNEFIKVRENSALKNVYLPDRNSAELIVRRTLDSNSSYSVKYRVLCKDGSIKWIMDSGKRVTNENGEILHYCFYHDVTELEERNIELKNTLTMLNQMVGSLRCGIFAYRMPRREIIVFNDEAKRLFDIDSDDVNSINDSNDGSDSNMWINKTLRERIFPEDFAKMSSYVRKIKNTGDSASYEFRIRHKDGSVCKVQVNSSLLEFNDGGKFILSSMLDVTAQSELTEIISEERGQYRDALLTNCEYAYSFDLTDGMITEEFVTSHGVNLFKRLGISIPVFFDDFIEQWIKNLKPQFISEGMELELSRDAMLKRFAGGERSTEVEYYSPETDVYTRVNSLMSRSQRNGHVIAVIVGTDTTKSRQREAKTKQALMDAYEAARRANSAKSDFLSRMSHDIRTPMNAIIGMTAIAGTHLDDKERIVDCLNKITVSSGHLLSLINEVLDMSKIESGKVDLNEEEFNLSDLVDSLIAIIRPQIKAKGQHLKVSINDVEHEKVIGDKLRLQQSFLNLMSNAIKYTPEGGSINFSIAEKASRSAKAGRYEFIFEDTGIGMSQEFVKHIFEPFSRATDSRVSKEEGTGLGLAITDNLVRMMNGNIRVESELGKGSKFTVNISLKLQDEEAISCDAFADLPVLVADDEPETCENACHILDEMGMKSEWVTSGEEAVEKVAERHREEDDYFAVILDWKMPGMDGIRATREIRRLVGSEVPIIIISAFDWSDIELEARAAGADAFIGKPLFKSRLAHVFHDMISGGEQRSTENDTDALAKEDFSGKRVLLVEDNELNREIAEELLEMAGLEVECAENGQIAVDKFVASENGYYNMIFMDIQMPIMNGNEAARAIRTLPRRDAKGIPIVAMTANAFSEDVQASLNAGMNEHIPKPLDLKQLVKALKTWLY